MKDSQTHTKKQRKFLKKKPAKSKATKKEHLGQSQTGSQRISISSRLKEAFNNYANDVLLLFIPVGLFFIFVILILLNNYFLKKIYATQVPPFVEVNKINPYPYVGEMPLLPLSAKAAIVLDSNSQVAI